MDKFDYRKESINFNDLIPDLFKTDVNISLFANGVDRLLTVEDSVPVQGYVGNNSNPNKNFIVEDSLKRQTYQLQPLIYSKTATVEHVSSFDDIVKKLEVLDEQGVIANRLDKWMKCDQFNFAPPIDADKFVNYKDYFWVDEDSPDYIVLNNPVTRTNSLLFELEASDVPNKATIKQQLLNQKEEQQKLIDNAFIVSKLNPSKIDSKYQWIKNNKWVHKSELIGKNNVKQANYPIIEYFDNLEINEWTYIKHNWQYRSTSSSDWVDSDTGPTNYELNVRYPIVGINGSAFVVNGDATSEFAYVTSLAVVGSFANSGTHTVVSATYDSVTNTSLITTDAHLNPHDKQNDVEIYSSTDYFGASGLYYGVIVPFTKTSKGDPWLGLFVHWNLKSVDQSVPVNHKPTNENQKYFVYNVRDYGYDVTPFDGSETDYGFDGQTRFNLPIDYILDTDDIQVYINGIRQYSTYNEAVDIDNNSYYNVDAYNSNLYDAPRHPKIALSKSIEFNINLNKGDIIVVKVGPACILDDYKHGCYVNCNGTVEFRNLIEYRIHEQIKNTVNQYLFFDIYNVDGTTNYSANEIFKFYEDPTAKFESTLNVRTDTSRNDFHLQNLLITDNNELLCYKEYTPAEVLNTVWRQSATPYKPKKVDKFRKTNSSLDKDWEIPEQLKCNVVHECRSILSFSEVFSHFRAMLSNQNSPYSYVSNTRVGKTLSRLDYVGGNIKEHNGGFDFFISAMHQDIINITSLIKFAKTQYSNNIYELRSHIFENTYSIVADNPTITIDELYKIATKTIKNVFTSNYKLDEVYYDTTSFDGTTGVKNWIATLPILGLYPAYEPIILKDVSTNTRLLPSIYALRHHDGHLSDLSITENEFEKLLSTFTLSTESVNGSFKNVNGVLYRYHVDYEQSAQPYSTFYGKRWLDTAKNELKQYNGSAWSVVPLSTAWDEFNPAVLIEQSLLSIETQLYNRAKRTRNKIDFSKYIINDGVTDSTSDTSVFVNYMKNGCLSYLKSLNETISNNTYKNTNAFTWNYNNIVSSSNPGTYVVCADGTNITTASGLVPGVWGSFWKQIYEFQYGTAYPHLEPWKLQNYKDKPEQWDSIYGDVTGTRRWKPIMWSNIRAGIIHTSLSAPLSVPKTYVVISVNDTAAAVGSYKSDDLLPPYVNVNTTFDTSHSLVRNVNLPASISAAPLFGQQGYAERKWKESIDYPYDLLLTLFKMQPVKMINDTFGHDCVNVNGLLVDQYTKNVPSYKNTVFHGSTVDNSIYLVNGINQWYVNALRHDRNAISLHDFVDTWKEWVPKLAYQTNTVLNSSSLMVDNDYFKLTNSDYDVIMKKSNGAFNQWMHTIRLSLATKGTTATNLLGNPVPLLDDWTYRVDTLVTEGNAINYYDVRKYTIKTIDISDNTINCVTTRNGVESTDLPWLAGDTVHINYDGIDIKSSNAYTLINVEGKLGLAIYDSAFSQLTQIKLYDTIPCYSYSTTVTTGEYLFAPQAGNIVLANDTISVITLNDYDIKYDTVNKKIAQFIGGKWIEQQSFILPNIGQVSISDGSTVLVPGTDYIINGTLVSISKTVSTLGVTNNGSAIKCYNYAQTVDNDNIFNSSTNRMYKVAHTSYMAQSSDISVSELTLRDYHLKYNLKTSTLTQYRIMVDKWVSTSNSFILPFIHDNIYLYDKNVPLVLNTHYTINKPLNKITLLTNVTQLSVVIAIPNNTIIEERYETFYNADSKKTWTHNVIDKTNVKTLTAPSTIQGIQNVINFIDGYASYLQDNGFSFNDFARPLQDPASDNLMGWQTELNKFISRAYIGFNTSFDNLTPYEYYDYIDINPFKYEFWINTPKGITSNILSGPFRDVSLYPIVYDNAGTPITSTENLKIFRTDKESHVSYPVNNDKFIGGMHLFIDFYEHAIIFNDYTTNNNMLFDSFLGLNNDLMQLRFTKHYETTKRPNIGGGFLVNNKIVDNLEASANMLSEFYNTYAPEPNKHVSAARSILGYNNDLYMDQMNSKSKFLFWKGMVHHKGTNDSVEKYAQINNIESIKLDEFWLYKIDDYGTLTPPTEYYINIKYSDINNDRIVYQLSNNIVTSDIATTILYDDPTRWRNLPDTDNSNMFEYTSTGFVRYIVNQYAIRSTLVNSVKNFDYKLFYQLDDVCDDVNVYVESNYNTILDVQYASEIAQLPYYIPNTGMISVIINGIKIKVTETSPTSIKLPVYNHKPKVVIIYNRGLLVKNVHYTFTSNKIIKIVDNFDWSICDTMDIESIRLDYSSLSSNIIDTKNDLIISPSNLYNPAYGIYNSIIDKVDYITDVNPANYNDNFWGSEHIEKKWIDTADLGYTMYYSDNVYPNMVDQTTAWGNTAEWSHITCYEWVSSNVLPEVWKSDTTGTPHALLMKRVRPSINDTFSEWYEEKQTSQVANAYDYPYTRTISIKVTLKITPAYDLFKVYVNEIETKSFTYTTASEMVDVLTVENVNQTDIVRIVRFADVPVFDTTEESLVEYKLDYKFNSITTYDATGTSKTVTYYFWASNRISRDNEIKLATNDIEEIFVVNPGTYSFVLPNNMIVIKNIDTYITTNDYAYQLIKNPSVQSTQEYVDTNVHASYSEWKMMRKHGINKVPRALWTKVTESLLQQSIDGSYQLPSYDRILFDRTNNTTTRYGAGQYQVIGEKDIILDIINKTLYEDLFDIRPLDKDDFIDQYNFNTNTNIITTMNYMYDNFTNHALNEIFFNILTELYASSEKVEGIMKTSMISLDCIFTVNTGS